MNALDHGRRLRIGGGCEGANHTKWLRQYSDIAFWIFLNHANRLVINDIEQRRAGFALNFEKLAVVIAQLRLIDRKLCNVLGDTWSRNRPHHGAN